MAINKKAQFPDKLIQLADYAKALSHPARLAILKTLAERDTCICGEIVEVMPLAQATVSQHLKELKRTGLVSGEVEGKKSCYCIDRDELAQLVDSWDQFFEELRLLQSDCC
ncbi:MAG: metalloregulator ArsR/SmtB family transcription factor [Saprospiraceae bacterium]|nr:metalloregulator ArsR/SmtB family transcription factor [Saprospiraceae bacterium]